MHALTYVGSQWNPISHKTCESKRAFHHNTWRARLARMKSKGGVQLRDLSVLINRCVDPEAYRFCTKTYKTHIYAALGATPDIRSVARQPLFTLLNAPDLQQDSRPLFADTAIPQAYIEPDWFERGRAKKRLLICATSRTHTLSMPLQVFQSYARQHFDGIAYLFDTSRNFYRDCLDVTTSCAEKLVEFLQPGTVGFLGTSAGASMAMHLCMQHSRTRAVAGSPLLDTFPELTRQLEYASVEELYRYLRITYGNNRIDNQYRNYFDRLSRDSSACVAINMSHISPTHASLGATTLNGMFYELLGWLAGSQASQTDVCHESP